MSESIAVDVAVDVAADVAADVARHRRSTALKRLFRAS
jgi:hypothetical protein